VIASRKTDSFPDVDKKSKNLFAYLIFGDAVLTFSTFVPWFEPLETAAKCSTTSSFF
jgi:hypothetical protein